MTPDQFRKLALEIPGSVESEHMQHPDFRIGRKIFATLGYPDDEHGMIKLKPEQQRTLIKTAPDVFAPSAGAWGRQGSTSVYLPKARVKSIAAALRAAATNLLVKKV